MPQSSFLNSRFPLLKKRPLVVGSLLGAPSLRSQLSVARSPAVDIVELRLDTFKNPSLEGKSLLPLIKKKTGKPVLLTFRSFTEAGHAVPPARRWNDSVRAAVLKPLVPSADLIDVEIRRTSFARVLSAAARKNKTGVIHSFHDFHGVPRPAVLEKFAGLSRSMNGDVFKVAVTPRDNDQVESFLTWGMTLPQRTSLIAMGETGLVSRFIGFSFGSVLTYGHLGVSAAPGQIHVAALARVVNEIYP